MSPTDLERVVAFLADEAPPDPALAAELADPTGRARVFLDATRQALSSHLGPHVLAPTSNGVAAPATPDRRDPPTPPEDRPRPVPAAGGIATWAFRLAVLVVVALSAFLGSAWRPERPARPAPSAAPGRPEGVRPPPIPATGPATPPPAPGPDLAALERAVDRAVSAAVSRGQAAPPREATSPAAGVTPAELQRAVADAVRSALNDAPPRPAPPADTPRPPPIPDRRIDALAEALRRESEANGRRHAELTATLRDLAARLAAAELDRRRQAAELRAARESLARLEDRPGTPDTPRPDLNPLGAFPGVRPLPGATGDPFKPTVPAPGDDAGAKADAAKVALLLQQLTDRDPAQRLGSIRSLGLLGPRASAAVDALARLRDDPKQPAFLRAEAASALRRIAPGGPR